MARRPGPLRLGTQEFPPTRPLVMAIVNRTPDSFYRPGITWDPGAALDRVGGAAPYTPAKGRAFGCNLLFVEEGRAEEMFRHHLSPPLFKKPPGF